ncbi:MAG TPA: cytochrome c [Nitrobacter sp.]|jgi:cytochrome c556|nr:cytochrome c [Nitrobacter sp.]
MMRSAIVAGILLLGLGAVSAQQDADKTAKTVMKATGKNTGALVAMVKGQKPYDQATVDASLAVLEETAKKLPTLFPDSLKGQKAEGDYSPSPKIWENKADFDAHIAALAKAVADAKGKIKDIDTLKASVGPIGKACGDCHQTFRVKNS